MSDIVGRRIKRLQRLQQKTLENILSFSSRKENEFSILPYNEAFPPEPSSTSFIFQNNNVTGCSSTRTHLLLDKIYYYQLVRFIHTCLNLAVVWTTLTSGTISCKISGTILHQISIQQSWLYSSWVENVVFLKKKSF